MEVEGEGQRESGNEERGLRLEGMPKRGERARAGGKAETKGKLTAGGVVEMRGELYEKEA